MEYVTWLACMFLLLIDLVVLLYLVFRPSIAPVARSIEEVNVALKEMRDAEQARLESVVATYAEYMEYLVLKDLYGTYGDLSLEKRYYELVEKVGFWADTFEGKTTTLEEFARKLETAKQTQRPPWTPFLR